MIIIGLEANKMILKSNALFANTVHGPLYSYTVLYCITIWPLDRFIIAECTKGFSMKTSLVNILCL